MTFSITETQHNTLYAMLLRVVTLGVVMLSVVMLNVVMLSVVILNVVAPERCIRRKSI